MNSSRRAIEVVPVTAVREGSAYKVPRHQAPMDLMLDGNEGKAPPDELLQCLRNYDNGPVFRYPSTKSLEALLTERLGLSSGQLLVTAGADDGIDRICRTMLSEGREVLVPWPTFEMLVRYASVAGGNVTKVPWVPGSAFPVDDFIHQATEDTGLLMVVSPNNPTGSVVQPQDIQRLSEALPHVLILLDLAYVEFADKDLTELALTLPNVVVTRTLSKAWGLAGLRVGYAVSNETVIGWLRVAGEPYAVSGPSLVIAEERLRTGEEEVDEFISFVRNSRSSLESLLDSLGARVIPSQGNFVFAEVSDSLWMRDAMAGMGIGIRAFPGKPALERGIRITSPRNEQQAERLEHALRTVMKPEAILFDMDGVLADVTPSYRQAILSTAQHFGVTLEPSDITEIKEAGDANNDWIVTQRLLAARGVEVSLQDVTEVFESFYQGTEEQPGLWTKEKLLMEREALQELAKAYPLAIVTGRPRRDALRFLEQYDISDCFRCCVCMEDAPAKPNPAPVTLAMEKLGVLTAWMIGDTPDDVRAARGAQVLPLGIVASGDDAEKTSLALVRAGAARVVAQTSDIVGLLP
ncbi:MAG: TIGR01548 family HAD-type hydrolase [Deltaproteobacteria bacterium]|nr:MAG: TIGR01548 family HAD-type hydrolase [Deltaproteobacteria bacterium]